jgi:predicted GNAT family acetyltransferase
VALAGFRQQSDTVGDPGIITHPESRGRGYATAAASRVVENAIELGRLVLYVTLESNIAAVSVATRLGFEQYATHVAVRLRDP